MRQFIFLLVLICGSAIGQSTNITTIFHGNTKKADIYFKHMLYRNALNLYLHANDQDPGNVYIMEQIAECYFLLHDPESAEKWFDKVINYPGLHPRTKYEYGETLSMNGKYEESKFWFEEYLKENPNSRSAKEKVSFLEKVEYYFKDTVEFLVMSPDFNTNHSEYGAHYFHEGLVFASSRDEDLFIKHKASDGIIEQESLLNMYYVSNISNGQHGPVKSFHEENLKTFLHEGPMAFYDNETKAAYTATNSKNGRPIYDKNKRSHLQIYFADIDKLSRLSNIQPFQHNDREYSLAHPTFSQDGTTMYFTSTAPGGFGGSDIYRSKRYNNGWTKPENAGPVINTPEDESFPFLANDTTLYFSSNGHGSLGGLDILVSYNRNGKFTRPMNFGDPLNTRYDDFAFVADSTGRTGYFASNRPGGKGLDDVYYFMVTNYFLIGKLKSTNENSGIRVYAIDAKTGSVIDSARTDNRGLFKMKVPFEKEYKIVAQDKGMQMVKDVPLSTKGLPLGIDSIQIELTPKELFAKGRIFDNETQQQLPGVKLEYRENNGAWETIDLGNDQSYSIKLNRGNQYDFNFSKNGYVSKSLSINTKGTGNVELLNDIVLEQESIQGVVINFEYKKSKINKDAEKSLNTLIEILKKYPEAKINIGAHADARGTKENNQKLSDLRAKATADYFKKKGIPQGQITWKGFGEELILNQCSEGVKCAEDDHRQNRRAEIKVQSR